MATTYYTDLQKLYVAYFNRPADTAGLAFWEGVVEKANGSTAAVSATFAASAEYKAAFAGQTNAQIVNTVYLNLFGRAAEQAGIDYWGKLLDAGTMTIDKAVTLIAQGALGADATAYNNKVSAASTFTAALGTTNAYSGDVANAAAKVFMAGITTDASLSAAIAPFTLGATVAKVNAAGTTFALDNGLAALTAANAAHTAFLAYADGDNNATTSTTDAAVAANVATAITAIDAKVAGYAAASAGVRAALLADQQAANSTKLATDQATLATANTKIAAVAGLSTALSNLDAAKAAVTAAGTADASASLDMNVKLATYNVLNGNAGATVDLTNAATMYNVGTIIVTDGTTGALKLGSGITETNHPGVTNLLASLNTLKAADANVTATNAAQVSAQTTVDGLDLTAQAVTDLQAVAADFHYVSLTAGALPTTAQITTEQAQLHAVTVSAAAIAAQPGATAAQTQAATDAQNAETAFNNLVTTFHTDDNANPLVAARDAATLLVTGDQTTITGLSTALTNLDKANGYNAQLNAVNAQITAAQTAFTSHNLMLPVSLTATAALATAGADIFVAGTAATQSITNFGLLGADSLYIGTQYTLGTDMAHGNDSILEAFIVSANSGADTQIVLEKQTFASHEVAPETITITLTGVAASHVHLSNGIITIV